LVIVAAGYPDTAIAGPLTLLATHRLSSAYGVSPREFSSKLAENKATLPERLARTVKIG
jgi:hypothetical protein